MSGPPVVMSTSECEDRRTPWPMRRASTSRVTSLRSTGPPKRDEFRSRSPKPPKARRSAILSSPRTGSRPRRSGIVRGAYHFAHPRNGAATEAQAFLDTVRAHGLQAGDLLALDLETSDNLPPARVAGVRAELVRGRAPRHRAHADGVHVPGLRPGGQLRRSGSLPTVDRGAVRPGRAACRAQPVVDVEVSPVRDGPGRQQHGRRGRVQRGHRRPEEVRQSSAHTQGGGRSAERVPEQRRQRRHPHRHPAGQREADRIRLR